MTIHLFRGLLFTSLFSLTVMAAGTAPAATMVNCSPAQIKILVSTQQFNSRTSTTYGNIPEATVSFIQHGEAASCVIVRFSAFTVANTTSVLIRALLDDMTVSNPGASPFSSNSAGASSYDFIFPSVAPGRHQIHMQFRSQDGSQVIVHDHNMVVQYQ